MKKQSAKRKNILRNINIIITILVVLANVAALIFSSTNKTNFIIISFFINVYIFGFHWYLLEKQIKKNLNEIKREILYINYPVNIGTFLFCLFLILLVSAIVLYIVNKAAFIPAFILTFFMSIISMLFPSILLLVYIFFVLPAFIIPGIRYNKNQKEEPINFLLIFLVLFSIFTAYKLITYSVRNINLDKQEKYQIITLPIRYSTQYLELKDISPYGKKKLSQAKVSVPFVYTSESFNYKDYELAESFCESLGARVPNYLEMYNIAFNKFDTFGEKYYWTSNKDGKTPILIQFKNMSYNVIKYDGKVKPSLYCVANELDNKKVTRKNYLYRNVEKENKQALQDYMSKPFDDNSLLDLLGQEYNQEYKYGSEYEVQGPYTQSSLNNRVNSDKRHVNFSVKEVTSDIMQQLIQKGYSYDPQIKISPNYETNDAVFDAQINRDANHKNIRLCYYPFMDYGNMDIFEESQIWKQSFCSPAFELIEPVPVLKTKAEKDSYCYSKGGRVPNIPELNGILKSLSINNVGAKFWTNTKVIDQNTKAEMPVLVYYKDSRFMKVHALMLNETESAYTYCIKKSSNPSKVIANYKSRFKGMEGSTYAKNYCIDCQYYEVPDTILMSY